MKKIILAIVLFISFLKADVYVGVSTPIKVNGDTTMLTYYCVDNKLWLEYYISGSKSTTVKFTQVTTEHTNNTMGCMFVDGKVIPIKLP